MITNIIDVEGNFPARISIGLIGKFHTLFCKVPIPGNTVITNLESLKTLRDDLTKYIEQFEQSK